jgi:hypothetical protein
LSGAPPATAEAVLARYAVGATVPCAIDDRDPRRAYVERGFGGADLFALMPLSVLALGVRGLASDRRRRHVAPQSPVGLRRFGRRVQRSEF